jgi:hypothetical protein
VRIGLRTLLAQHVLAALSAAGIEPMPLKGALFARWLYADPDLRPGDDVDVLVRPADFARATEVLAAEGFAPLPAPESHYQRGFLAPAVPVAIDLHQSLFPRRFYRVRTEELFERGSEDRTLFGCRVILPDPYDAYAHLVGHAAAGRFRKLKAAHQRDLALLVGWFDLEPGLCAARLDGLGLSRAARYALEPTAATDPFATELLRALPPDPLGRALVALARALAGRLPHDCALARYSIYLTNDSLPRSFGRLARRLLQTE